MVNNNDISDIKIDMWTRYGIMLYTGITDAYGHYQPFTCYGEIADGGGSVKLSETGEDIIDIDELTTLKIAKEYIINNYSENIMINFN